MKSSVVAFLSLSGLTLASPVKEQVSTQVKPEIRINGTVEYATECKKCPYKLCTNVSIRQGKETVTATCWAK